MIQPKIFITKSNNLPNYRLNADHDHYFVPFYISTGASSVSENLMLNQIQYEQIFSAKNKTLMLKTVDWEKKMTPIYIDKSENIEISKETVNEIKSELVKQQKVFNVKNLVFERHFQIGTYFLGKIIQPTKFNISFQKTFNNYLKQLINTDIVVFFNQQSAQNSILSVWNEKSQSVNKQFLYLFFAAPELASRDFLYIKSCQIILDQWGKYHSHILTLSSLEGIFSNVGQILEQRLQLAAPGDKVIFPHVGKRYIPKKDEDELESLFEETFQNDKFLSVKNSKKLYINQFFFNQTEGIKHIQIESKGMLGWLGIRVYGSKKIQHNSKYLHSREQQLFIFKFNPGVASFFQKSEQRQENFALIGNGTAEIRMWFTDWKQDYGYVFNPKNRRDNEAVIAFSKEWDQLWNKKSYPVYQNQEQQIIDLAGIQNLGFHPFFNLNLQAKLNNQNPEQSTFQPANLTTKNMTAAQFLNYNAFLLSYLNFLEIGSKLITNNKGFAETILRDVTGVLGAGIGKFTSFFRGAAPLATGYFALTQIAQRTMSWLPNSLFTKVKTLLPSASINIMINADFLLFVQNWISANLTDKKAFFPLALLSENWKNEWSQLLGTETMNEVLNFEITHLINNKDSLGLVSGVEKLPWQGFLTNKSNETYIISGLEILAIGERDLTISFAKDKELKNVNCQFNLMTRSKFSSNKKDILTRIFFGSWNTEKGNYDAFKDSFLDKYQQKEYFLADLEALINAGKDFLAKKEIYRKEIKANIKDLNFQQDQEIIFEHEKSNEWVWTNLGSKTVEIKLDSDLIWKNQHLWDLLKKSVNAKNYLWKENLGDSEDENNLRNWLKSIWNNRLNLNLTVNWETFGFDSKISNSLTKKKGTCKSHGVLGCTSWNDLYVQIWGHLLMKNGAEIDHQIINKSWNMTLDVDLNNVSSNKIENFNSGSFSKNTEFYYKKKKWEVATFGVITGEKTEYIKLSDSYDSGYNLKIKIDATLKIDVNNEKIVLIINAVPQIFNFVKYSEALKNWWHRINIRINSSWN